jgi:DNA-binding protein HU-beta
MRRTEEQRPMNKAALVQQMAKPAGLSPLQAARALAALLEGIEVALSRRERVILKGLGTFTVRSRAGRKGHHPRTGQALAIPAHNSPNFRAGKRLRTAVQSGQRDRVFVL